MIYKLWRMNLVVNNCWLSQSFLTWPKMLDFTLKESGHGHRFCLLSLSPERWLLGERCDMQPCRILHNS